MKTSRFRFIVCILPVLLLSMLGCRAPKGVYIPPPVLPTRLPVQQANVRSQAPVPATYTPAPTPVSRLITRLTIPSATSTPPPTSTAGPYSGLSVVELAWRSYGEGPLEVVEEMERYGGFTRYLVRYPSDGLNVFGFMNVPHGNGPFPVVVALHGFIDLNEYQTLDYTTRYADALAGNGFLVLHPNYRNHPPSDPGPNLFRVGYAVDVLNLLALVQAQGGRPGPLEKADGNNLHLWGHSMGGGIALRVLTVNPAIRSAVLYAAMGGDEQRNFERILEWSEGEVGHAELATPPDIVARISPANHLQRIRAAVSIHHGTADSVVPSGWSTELCADLQGLHKRVSCFNYAGQPHNFGGEGDRLFQQRVLDFFREHSTP